MESYYGLQLQWGLRERLLGYKGWSNLAESKPLCFLTLLTRVGG